MAVVFDLVAVDTRLKITRSADWIKIDDQEVRKNWMNICKHYRVIDIICSSIKTIENTKPNPLLCHH